jgi:acetoin utilization protein AcuB
MLTAADVMTEEPVAINMTATVGHAARMLDALAVRHLPVINDDHELVGMLSDRDLRGDPAGAGSERELVPAAPPPGAPVSDVMSTDVVQVGADASLGEIASHMVESRVGAVPIVDNDGRLLGIVSYVDVLRAVAEAEEEAVPGAARATRKRVKKAVKRAKRAVKHARKATKKPAARRRRG